MTTSIDFPTSLPAPLQGTLEEDFQETFVDDASGVGSPRRRARFTRGLRRWSYSIQITEAQRVSLTTFYDTTLSNGVSSFNWIQTKSSVSYEVVFSNRPKIKHVDDDLYTADVSIEEI